MSIQNSKNAILNFLKINLNLAKQGGGANFNSNYNITLKNSDIFNNYSHSYGGGLYIGETEK